MKSNSHSKITIIGSGPAGLTAALYTARANLAPVLIHGPTPGGQLTTTTDVENFPGFPEGIMGPDLMGLMEKQVKRFGTELVTESVTAVNLKQRPFEITTQSGRLMTCDCLIIATGATPRWLGLESERELMGYGVSTCATCDGAFFRNQVICVAGGGDSACEEALFLTRFGAKVHLIHRRDELRASKIMQERVLHHPKIEVLWNKQVTKINGSRQGGVTGVVLRDSVSGKTDELGCQAIFIAIGHIPNSSLSRDS
jgi:thioredoxin reductase (NADPH)